MPARRTPEPEPGTFADRLDRVWSACQVPANKAAMDRLREDRNADVPMAEPSYQEVADFVSRRTTGRPYSAAYLGMLRRGERDNPTISLVLGLAEYFRVHRDELLGPSDVVSPAGTPDNGVPDRAASLAERLTRLYERLGPAGDTAMEAEAAAAIDAEVAAEIGEDEYVVYRIRTGKMTDVQISVLRRLALYFGVPVEYFVADDGEVSETVALAGVLQREGLIAYAKRALEAPGSESEVPLPFRSALATLLGAAIDYDAKVAVPQRPTVPNGAQTEDSFEPADVVPDEKSR